MIYDVVIIGGGPGGYTAALYCARANLNTLLLEKLAPGGQMGTTDRIDNYPGFPEGVGGFELSMQMKQGAERFGMKTRMAEVKEVNLKGLVKTIKTSKEIIEARALILASGGYPAELGLPRERELRGRGISYCATCDGMFYRGKTVAVVGGGNTAVADVLYLANICKRVYLIHRRDELRASAVYTMPLSDCKNVSFLYHSEVKGLLGGDRLTGIQVYDKETKEQQELSVDGLFIAVGNMPSTELYKGQLKLDQGGYIPADETTKTEIPGVFAVGDLRRKPLRQIITAAADGAVASHFVEEYLQTEMPAKPLGETVADKAERVTVK